MTFTKTREKVCMTYTIEIDDVHRKVRINHSRGLINANENTEREGAKAE